MIQGLHVLRFMLLYGQNSVDLKKYWEKIKNLIVPSK